MREGKQYGFERAMKGAYKAYYFRFVDGGLDKMIEMSKAIADGKVVPEVECEKTQAR
jgi:hypothetical protein